MDVAAARGLAGRLRGPIRGLDPVLLVTGLGLAVFGILMVFSATHQSLTALDLDRFFFVKKQMVALFGGLTVLVLAVTFDYRLAKVYAPLAYGAMIFLLILVKTPLGTSTGGAQRGFSILGFQFTPSEFTKIALILMLASFLSESRASELTLRTVWRATGIAVLAMLLVFLQPDLGTTIILAVILVGILIVAGARARHLGVLALSAGVLLFGAFHLGVVKEYQVQRLVAFLDPKDDPRRGDYNRLQSEIAIGSGGLTGRGYLHGTQTNLDFVPEQHTDFIFTVVGEEFGFVGAAFLLLLFAVLLWRGFRVAMASKDRFGTYVAAGVVSMLALQMFVNVGMTLGIMPITGIPLPFVSYGGSSLVANFLAVGLLLNIHMRRFTV